jgi:hypothetical protein
VVAALACLANVTFVVFGLIGLAMTGYAFDAALTNPTAWMDRIVVVAIAAVAAATVSYVAAQRQHGRPVRLTDPSDELPSAEALAGAAGRQPALRSGSGISTSSFSQSGTQTLSSFPSAPGTQTHFSRPG